MSISTYAELQTAVLDWMSRSDLTGNVEDFITLAEAKLNRRIPAVQTDVTLTGTLNARRIDVSANSVVSGIALFLIDPSTSDERQLVAKQDGTFAYDNTSGEPRYWAMDSTSYVDFDCPLDTAYTFRFRIKQRYALSDSATTNWLLTYHPDIYLAASILWGGGFTRDLETASGFKSLLDEGIPEVRRVIAEMNRSELTVDRALQPAGPFDWFNA
jgi:hypothetical protein